jgi:hypothetical protein
MTDATRPAHDEHRLAQRVYCATCGDVRSFKDKWAKPCDGGAEKRARRAAAWGQAANEQRGNA